MYLLLRIDFHFPHLTSINGNKIAQYYRVTREPFIRLANSRNDETPFNEGILYKQTTSLRDGIAR